MAIIGSGFSGLGMAIQLRKRGRDDFLILEKSHDIGGTWRDNTYPGCGCDVPTAIYSYSFEQNPYWSKMWASQPEIQAYLQRITDKYDLRRKVAFDAELVEAHWDDVATRWRGRLADGRTVSAQFLVISASPLHVPRIPELSGIESFTGPAFHSARWDHSVDLTGKKVAVIGTGASAIQFVPIIAEHVEQLQVYQRSPAWILARPNPTMPKLVQKLFAKVALSRKVFRYINYWIAEFLWPSRLNGYGNLHKAAAMGGRGQHPQEHQGSGVGGQAHPRVSVRLQAPPFFPHLLPGVGAAQRRGDHRRYRRGTTRQYRDRRRRRARGGRDHLRHRVPGVTIGSKTQISAVSAAS